MTHRLLLAVLAASFSVAHPAWAGGTPEYTWCVDAEDSEPGASCLNGTPCSNEVPFLTIAEAVTSAAEVPDLPDEERPFSWVCVSSPVHTESFTIDGSDGSIQELVLEFARRDGASNWCPAASGEVMATVVSDPSQPMGFEIRGAVVGSDCENAPAPVLHTTGAGNALQGVRIEGAGSPTFEILGPDSSFSLVESRVEGNVGPVVASEGYAVRFSSSEVSRSTAVGAPLIQSAGNLVFEQSAVFGNVSDGAPLLQVGQIFHLYRSVLAANVVVGSVPMVTAAAWPPANLFSGISQSVVSRNRLLGDGSAQVAAAAFVPIDDGFSSRCLPIGSDGLRYRSRPEPTSTGALSEASLFEVSGGAGDGFTVLKSFVVENQLAGPIVRVEGGPQFASLQSTFGGGPFTVLGGTSTDGDGRFLSARNLFAAQVLPNQVPQSWGVIESSMDLFLDATSARWSLGPLQGIDDPAMTASQSVEFLTVPDVENTWSECRHVQELCGVSDCDEPNPDQAMCVLDAAMAYIPTDSITDYRQPFPWDGRWFQDQAVGDLIATPGATGFGCGEPAVPFDLRQDDAFPEGDEDGFTTLTDCNNESVDIIPVQPSEDGITTPGCAPASCYICPKGTVSDDDDATDDDDTTDDDDIADDDDATPVADGDDDPNCTVSGCGFSWRLSAVWILGGLALSFRRRERS